MSTCVLTATCLSRLFRKQMKPFTIRKAAQPSRAGAQGGLGAAGDASVDASFVKQDNTVGGVPDRGNGYGPLGSTTQQQANNSAVYDAEEETLLNQDDLDRLAEEFPGKKPENPWIREQTNRQFLTQIKVSL